jgi:hypothetical protein
MTWRLDEADLVTNESKKHEAANDGFGLESMVMGLVELASLVVKTFVTLAFRPWKAPQVASNESARPLSFLVVSLLVSGLSIQTALLYHGRSLDEHLFALVADAMSSWGLQMLFFLTIPPLFVVCVSAVVIAWWGNIKSSSSFRDSFVLRGTAHTVGVQVLIIACAAVAFIGFKAVSNDSANDSRMLDEALCTLIVVVGLSGIVQTERLIHSVLPNSASSIIRRVPNAIGRSLFAGVTSIATLCAVIAVMSQTFDLKSIKSTASRLSLEEWAGKARVLVDVLDSQVDPEGMAPEFPGFARIVQQISLTNVSNMPHAIPRPSHLELNKNPHSLPITVLSCSIDKSDQYGWVIQPGETRLASWVLIAPRSLMEQENPSASFECIEINIARWHDDIERPLGEPTRCYVGWSWPEQATDIATRVENREWTRY